MESSKETYTREELNKIGMTNMDKLRQILASHKLSIKGEIYLLIDRILRHEIPKEDSDISRYLSGGDKYERFAEAIEYTRGCGGFNDNADKAMRRYNKYLKYLTEGYSGNEERIKLKLRR